MAYVPPVWLSPTYDSTKAWCNHILRMDFRSANFYKLDPPAPTPHEIDHFIEVQHVVDLLFTERGTLTVANFPDVKLAYWINLSTFVNQSENMYQISSANNQIKKGIKLVDYLPANRNILIERYMDQKTVLYHQGSTQIGKTVGQQIKELAVKMAWYNKSHSFLTRQVGQQICELFGWREGILSQEQHLRIGDYEPQEWVMGEFKRRGI